MRKIVQSEKEETDPGPTGVPVFRQKQGTPASGTAELYQGFFGRGVDLPAGPVNSGFFSLEFQLH